MESTVKVSTKIIVVLLTIILGIMVIQPVILSNNSNEDGQINFTANHPDGIIVHRSNNIQDINNTASCPYVPCGGWW